MNFYLVEREENVKADIFAAYITLLRQTRPVASQTLDAEAMEDDSGWEETTNKQQETTRAVYYRVSLHY